MVRRAVLAALLAVAATGSAAAQPVAAPDCTVAGRLTEGEGLALDIAYACRADRPLEFVAGESQAARFVHDLRIDQRDGLAQATYRFDLSGFARSVDSTRVAVARGHGVLAILGAWLLEPQGYGRPPVIDIRMSAAPGLEFAAGLPKVGDAWRLAGTSVRFAGYSALGRLSYRELPVAAPGSMRPGATPSTGVLRVALLDGIDAARRDDVFDWVARTAQAQSHYWHGFTTGQGLLGLVPMAGRRGVGYGRTVSGGGVSVMVELGSAVDRRILFEDWVLTHELIHTGMPFIRDARGRGTWFMEGAATYVEPIIRARAGWKTEEEVWHEWIANMPRGVGAFSVGLAQAQGAQNYWGGAIFMLLADLDLRRATDGRMGLEDCLAGALASGLDGPRRVGLGEYAAACDRATGTRVMTELVDRHFTRAEPMDLASLWQQLGVSMVGGRILYDDRAPAARWRRMIVPGRQPGPRVKLPWES
ncbi:hypothetical protein [Reyranella sp.]|uniref:hypothetical protein n=1 Tax=Reyranella sp. TaxID=1929291 RepID=UPI003BA95C8E